MAVGGSNGGISVSLGAACGTTLGDGNGEVEFSRRLSPSEARKAARAKSVSLIIPGQDTCQTLYALADVLNPRMLSSTATRLNLDEVGESDGAILHGREA